MSGPKSSSYTLSYEQRRRIEEEQRRRREQEEEKRRLSMETQKKNEQLAKLVSEIERVTSKASRLEFLKGESGYSVPVLDEIKHKLEHTSQECKKLQRNTASTSSAVHKENVHIDEMIRATAVLFSQCEDQIATVTDQYRSELDSKISAGFHLSFSNIGIRKNEDNSEIKKINEALAQLSDIDLSDSLQAHFSIIRSKSEEITDRTFLQNFYSVVVVPFIKDCKAYSAIREEHDELLIHYATLAAECNVSPKPVPYTREGIEFLKDEIAILEERALEIREKEFIKSALDEAMREMGYVLVGDRIVAKKSGKRIQHELYSLEDGTAVDITYADNGQISMELGGIDQIDRQPDALESAQLVEDMKSFASMQNFGGYRVPDVLSS